MRSTEKSGTPAEILCLKLYLGSAFAVFVLMMLAGIVMRAGQAGWLTVSPDLFYQLMTVHGAGMVGISGLAGASVMWYFLRTHVWLDVRYLYANLTLFLLGVVFILASVFIGGYAGAWTFLWPLPAKSMGLWSNHAAAGFILGLTLIGVGFLLFYLDAAFAITRRFGSLYRGLGVDQLISGRIDLDHPPTVVASTMVIVVNTIGILVGAVVLVVTLVNLYYPEFVISTLLAKNLIYFFGHVFINASIYMAVTAVYELLPRYTGRPWKVSRAFFAAWAAVTLFVMAVYPHHLLLDTVMPRWLLAMGQVISYLSGIPVLLVTAYGALMSVHRSGVQWTAPARWLFVSMLGWSVGVIPAIVDGTIHINKVMHNTMWVPGHFHLYLLLGLLPMVIGFALYLVSIRQALNEGLHKAAINVYGYSSAVFCAAFLLGGWSGEPRRWAQHWESWQLYDRIGAIAAVGIVLVMLYLTVVILRALFMPILPAGAARAA